MKKKITLTVTAVILVLALCSSCSDASSVGIIGGADGPTSVYVADKNAVNVEITMVSGGKIELVLDSKSAPKTVENFVKLVEEGFYDGLTFHRVIPDFMIQGGDPNGDGTGGSDETIYGEFSSNGWKDNNISHERGVISMARKSQPLDSATSQFFITNADSTFLDGNYAAFGYVTSGMDVVDEISAVETDANDKPLEPVVIESIRIIE